MHCIQHVAFDFFEHHHLSGAAAGLVTMCVFMCHCALCACVRKSVCCEREGMLPTCECVVVIFVFCHDVAAGVGEVTVEQNCTECAWQPRAASTAATSVGLQSRFCGSLLMSCCWLNPIPTCTRTFGWRSPHTHEHQQLNAKTPWLQ